MSGGTETRPIEVSRTVDDWRVALRGVQDSQLLESLGGLVAERLSELRRGVGSDTAAESILSERPWVTAAYSMPDDVRELLTSLPRRVAAEAAVETRRAALEAFASYAKTFPSEQNHAIPSAGGEEALAEAAAALTQAAATPHPAVATAVAEAAAVAGPRFALEMAPRLAQELTPRVAAELCQQLAPKLSREVSPQLSPLLAPLLAPRIMQALAHQLDDTIKPVVAREVAERIEHVMGRINGALSPGPVVQTSAIDHQTLAKRLVADLVPKLVQELVPRLTQELVLAEDSPQRACDRPLPQVNDLEGIRPTRGGAAPATSSPSLLKGTKGGSGLGSPGPARGGRRSAAMGPQNSGWM